MQDFDEIAAYSSHQMNRMNKVNNDNPFFNSISVSSNLPIESSFQ